MSTKNQKPVLVDDSLFKAFSIKYFIYAVFGLSGLLVAVPSIAETAGEFSARAISATIMVLGALSAFAVLRAIDSTGWERVEFYSTIGLISFVAMYDVSAIYLAALGSDSRINLAIIASALLVMPLWRVRWILKKNRKT